VLRQPDPLEPDDQRELEAAAASAVSKLSIIAAGERPNAKQPQVELRSAVWVSITPKSASMRNDPNSAMDRREVQLMA